MTKPRPTTCGRCKEWATARRAAGFTLAEIMLAMGVLGIGMVMVATIFPTAMLQTKQADDNTQAMLIAENAEAIIRMSMSHGAAMISFAPQYIPNDTTPVDLAWPATAAWPYNVYSGNRQESIHRLDRVYPALSMEELNDLLDDFSLDIYNGDPIPPDNEVIPGFYDAVTAFIAQERTFGWLALGRRMNADQNDYFFHIIPYRKFPGFNYNDPTNGYYGEPMLMRIQLTKSNDPLQPLVWQYDEVSYESYIAIGSPVVRTLPDRSWRRADYRRQGLVAEIVGVDLENNTVTLSNDLMVNFDAGPGQMPEGGATEEVLWVWVVPGVEAGGPSPALGCFTFRTALKP